MFYRILTIQLESCDNLASRKFRFLNFFSSFQLPHRLLTFSPYVFITLPCFFLQHEWQKFCRQQEYDAENILSHCSDDEDAEVDALGWARALRPVWNAHIPMRRPPFLALESGSEFILATWGERGYQICWVLSMISILPDGFTRQQLYNTLEEEYLNFGLNCLMSKSDRTA